MFSGIYPARRQPVMGCPDNPTSRLPRLDLSLVPLGYLGRGRVRLALLPWPGDKMPPIGGLAHPSPRRERGGFDHMVSDGI